MATTSSLLSLHEYLHTDYRPDAHFVEGVIEERHLGEYDHAKLQTLISFLFTSNEDLWHTDSVVEQRIRVAHNRVRVCDIAILHTDAPHEPVTLTPPYICIEVMSPEDHLTRAKTVLADYLAMGVPNIWLIDPNRRKAYTFTDTALHEATPLLLSVPNTDIALDVAALLKKLDARAKAGR